MMSQITHFTLLCSQHVKKKDTKKARYPDAAWMKDILSFYDEKSHTISHKKLGTMMPRMTHLQYHDEVNDT